MPRLSPSLYLERHDFLRDLWLHDNYCFGCLSVQDQWEVHRYYQPSVEISDLKLLEIRKKLDAEQPSLGSRVGKLYVRICCAHLGDLRRRELRALTAANPPSKPAKRKNGMRSRLLQSERRLSVVSVANPELDVHKLARAVMLIAEQLAKAEDQRNGAQRAADAASAWSAMAVPGGLTEPTEGVVDGAVVDTEPVTDRDQ